MFAHAAQVLNTNPDEGAREPIFRSILISKVPDIEVYSQLQKQ